MSMSSGLIFGHGIMRAGLNRIFMHGSDNLLLNRVVASLRRGAGTASLN